MTKREAMRLAREFAAENLSTQAPGDVWDETWGDMSVEDQERCAGALEAIARRLRREP